MRVNSAEARQRLPELLRVAAGGEVVMVDVRGKPSAAIVPADVGERWRRLAPKLVPMGVIEAAVARAAKVDGVERIVLFGSYARGDAREKSDVDLLVVISAEANPEGGGPFWDVYKAVSRELRDYDVSFELVPVTVAEWNDKTSALLQEVREEGVVLSER